MDFGTWFNNTTRELADAESKGSALQVSDQPEITSGLKIDAVLLHDLIIRACAQHNMKIWTSSWRSDHEINDSPTKLIAESLAHDLGLRLRTFRVSHNSLSQAQVGLFESCANKFWVDTRNLEKSQNLIPKPEAIEETLRSKESFLQNFTCNQMKTELKGEFITPFSNDEIRDTW